LKTSVTLLRKESDKRYPNAAALAQALRQLDRTHAVGPSRVSPQTESRAALLARLATAMQAAHDVTATRIALPLRATRLGQTDDEAPPLIAGAAEGLADIPPTGPASRARSAPRAPNAKTNREVALSTTTGITTTSRPEDVPFLRTTSGCIFGTLVGIFIFVGVIALIEILLGNGSR
jgi:hypothetical protein